MDFFPTKHDEWKGAVDLALLCKQMLILGFAYITNYFYFVAKYKDIKGLVTPRLPACVAGAWSQSEVIRARQSFEVNAVISRYKYAIFIACA